MPRPWEGAVGSGLACMSEKWGEPAAGETLETLACVWCWLPSSVPALSSASHHDASGQETSAAPPHVSAFVTSSVLAAPEGRVRGASSLFLLLKSCVWQQHVVSTARGPDSGGSASRQPSDSLASALSLSEPQFVTWVMESGWGWMQVRCSMCSSFVHSRSFQKEELTSLFLSIMAFPQHEVGNGGWEPRGKGVGVAPSLSPSVISSSFCD